MVDVLCVLVLDHACLLGPKQNIYLREDDKRCMIFMIIWCNFHNYHLFTTIPSSFDYLWPSKHDFPPPALHPLIRSSMADGKKLHKDLDKDGPLP